MYFFFCENLKKEEMTATGNGLFFNKKYFSFSLKALTIEK
jgi:hypothetical protein